VPDSEFILDCDQVVKAIGQEKLLALFEAFGLELERGYVKVDEHLCTSNPKVFAGGDCIRVTGQAMTVTATQDGKIAAASIHAWLKSQEALAAD
jgi:dihydropyrimidine dehydrogenase (NAD+) subunit PreT